MFDEVKGFAVTFKRLFAPKITIQYPDEKRHMAPRYPRPAVAAGRSGNRRGALRRLRAVRADLPDILPRDARRAL